MYLSKSINSNIIRNEEVRKLTTGQSKDYTTGCLLGYSRQKELDADSKAIQQIEFVRQLKNVAGVDANGPQSMSVLAILGKIKETRLKFPQVSVTVL